MLKCSSCYLLSLPVSLRLGFHFVLACALSLSTLWFRALKAEQQSQENLKPIRKQQRHYKRYCIDWILLVGRRIRCRTSMNFLLLAESGRVSLHCGHGHRTLSKQKLKPRHAALKRLSGFDCQVQELKAQFPHDSAFSSSLTRISRALGP